MIESICIVGFYLIKANEIRRMVSQKSYVQKKKKRRHINEDKT
jgi:hypothetical protein